MKMKILRRLFFLFAVAGLFSCQPPTLKKSSFESDFTPMVTRYFIGPQYWANPMQDWQIADGRLECLVSENNRNTQLLTWQAERDVGNFEISVLTGFVDETPSKNLAGWSGIRFGIKGQFDDYRDNAIYGKGLNAGISTNGKLFIGEIIAANFTGKNDTAINALNGAGVLLKLMSERTEAGFSLHLSAHNANDGTVIGEITKESIPVENIMGNVALVSDFPTEKQLKAAQSSKSQNTNDFEINFNKTGTGKNETPSFWYNNWNVKGECFVEHKNQEFGPIMMAMHTLSKKIIKMTVQMAPVGKDAPKGVVLQLKELDNWTDFATAEIDRMSRTAHFKIKDWKDKEDVQYRVKYSMIATGNVPADYFWEGTVRKNPVNKDEIVVAGFTGNNDLGFPNTDLVSRVMKHKPDLLVFTGDQIYERVGGGDIQTNNIEKQTIDYLRKWYLYAWEYRELLKDIPVINLPDDHDVYHGNVWGCGGKKANRPEDNGSLHPGIVHKYWQDDGGYKYDPKWVNMVIRTQTSHMPDPYDATPIKQNINVYHGAMSYGEISFAFIEDRTFKTAPKNVLPEKAQIENGWAENPKFNKPEYFDVEADLLGERQLNFLENWAADWTANAQMKCLLSQTIFANVATLPDSAISDVIVPKLRILKKGDYPKNDKPTQDMDANAWPKKGRDRAVRTIRKSFAFHLAGDQHLGSSVQYGVDEWGDAGYTLCVPSVANIWPRRWFPPEEGLNHDENKPLYTGDFLDGFGNKMTVLAVSNPVFTGIKPSKLYDRATGYGIVKFRKLEREIEFANWPREVEPDTEGTKPYEGWPITVKQEENYGREAIAYLPTIEVKGMLNPVVLVYNEANEELVYGIRINGTSFKPKVFENGKYTLKIGDQDSGNMKEFKSVEANSLENEAVLEVVFD